MFLKEFLLELRRTNFCSLYYHDFVQCNDLPKWSFL